MQNDNSVDNLYGMIVLYKPKGETSRTTLNRLQSAVRSCCHQGHKLRVGHAGTLDPLAEGVLIACVGEATKLIEVIQMLPKCYTGTFQLGVTSDTEDAEGTITTLPTPPQPTYDELKETIARFVGRIRQRPPAYSALKIAGKRAYQLARQGEHVELAAREIEVYRIDLVEYKYPIFRLKIECGSGTYVRSLGRDIGELLGSGAIMTALIRESIGPFSLADAVTPEMFNDRQSAAWCERLVPLELGVAHLPRVDLDAKTAVRLLLGQEVRKDEIPAPQITSENCSMSNTKICAAFARKNRLVSLLELIDSQYVKIRKNFAVPVSDLADDRNDAEI